MFFAVTRPFCGGVGPKGSFYRIQDTKGGEYMKKYISLAAVMVLGAGMAMANSISVPWFADNAPAASGLIYTGILVDQNAPVDGYVLTLVNLKNNTPLTINATIEYYNLDGALLGPFGADATFSIAANSSLSFRPVVEDPVDGLVGPGGTVGQFGGQERAQGVLVPNRPRSEDFVTPIPGTGGLVDGARTGTAVIRWLGGTPNDIQGSAAVFQTVGHNGNVISSSFGHLLPPGIPAIP
jgi:hypothetical protein